MLRAYILFLMMMMMKLYLDRVAPSAQGGIQEWVMGVAPAVAGYKIQYIHMKEGVGRERKGTF